MGLGPRDPGAWCHVELFCMDKNRWKHPGKGIVPTVEAAGAWLRLLVLSLPRECSVLRPRTLPKDVFWL